MEQNNQIYELLGDHWLTQVIAKQDLLNLLNKTTLVNYRKRETIVKKGEFSTHLVFLVSGFVKLEIEEGRRDFIIDIERGMKFLGLPLSLSVNKHLFSIVTLTDASVVFFPIDEVKGLIYNNAKFASKIISVGNENFVIPVLDKLTSAAQNNIRGRLAKLLVKLATKVYESNSFVLHVSRLELSHFIGFSRENVIRVLAEFNVEGLIKISGKNLEITNLAGLEEVAKNN